MKRFLLTILPYVLIVVVVLLIRTFLVDTYVVKGVSMVPNLEDGEFLLVNKATHNYKRFDVVILKYNEDNLVKRVIGLPGDTVEFKDNQLIINGEVVEDVVNTITMDFNLESLGYDVIPEDYYFVVGDNRPVSNDSRIIGLVPKDKIIGKAFFRILKFKVVK